MTISSYGDNISCDIRLTFGVPLEDVFPDGDVHPSLKNLFVEIYESLLISKVSLEDTLRINISNYNCILVQEALTLCKPIDYMPLTTLISTLRHFLGCLPLPLFPQYTDRKNFVWHKLASKCKHNIENYLKDQLNFQYLSELIATELLKLPPVNLLLIGYLVNFFRSLIIRPTDNERKTRSAALTIVNYFSSSLFIRPYNPNIPQSTKAAHQFHPLILYLLIKWPEIQITCVKKYPLCFVPAGKRNSKTGSINRDLYSIQTQTEFQLNIIEEEEYENYSLENSVENSSTVTVLDSLDISLSTDSFLSASECACDVYLKDVGVQTEPIFPEFKNISTQTENTKRKSENKCIKYIQEQLLKKSTSTQTSPKKISPNDSENSYIPFYDSDDFNIDDCVHKSSKTEQELVEHVSQIGWSYTNTNTPKDISEDESLKQTNIGWVVPSHKLCSGNKKESQHSVVNNINVANKCSNSIESNESNKIYSTIESDKINITAESEKNISVQVLNFDCKGEADIASTIPSSSNVNNDFALETNVQTPLNSTKSRKSILSLGKIKSKIDIFKIFKDRKLMGSTSEEQLGTCKIKYEKMTTVKSTLF